MSGVYIHIPFCARKCLYCDFVSFEKGDKEGYFEALKKEIGLYKEILSADKTDSIFIGGGTPSFVDSRFIEEILSLFNPVSGAEITIEANPGTLSSEKLKAYKRSGINRLSIGLQSANDSELKRLGRIHDFNDFMKSYEMAVSSGFENINIDLMFGIPGQTVESFGNTLEAVTVLKPQHISAYSLIIEEGTPFYDMELSLPSEEEEREMYNMILHNNKGYVRYEISNFALSGFECRHNLKYWRFEPFLGFGLNASSFYNRERYVNFSDFESYISAVSRGEKPISGMERESEEELIKDYIITSMRLSEGLSFEKFQKEFGISFFEKYGKITEEFIKGGFLKKTEKEVAFTDKGFEVSNSILEKYI